MTKQGGDWVWADCPHCDGQIEVRIEVVDEGEKPVYYPNDRAHPGTPPTVRIVGSGDRYDCDCPDADWDRLEEENYERLLEHADDAMQAAEDDYWEKKIQESKLKRRD